MLGFAFGFVLDLWNWYAFYPAHVAAFVARQATGFPFDIAHASGNLVLALAAGPELRRMLERYGRRLGRRSYGREARVLAAATVLSFVQGRAQPDGGYAEPGGRSTSA